VRSRGGLGAQDRAVDVTVAYPLFTDSGKTHDGGGRG
jgi:hypothetical protein